MHFYPNERLALFIDGANLYATAKALGFDIDYKRLLALFRTKGQLVRALYYTALAEDQEYSSIRPLVDWLDYNGYTMVTKPTKEFTDALGRRKIKGNMDIEICVDMMNMAEHVDYYVSLNSPWTYLAFGVKEVHRVRNQAESTDRIVGRYDIRLIQDRRSESNPSGLLVAEFSEQQMVGERDDELLQQSKITGAPK